MYTTLSPSEQLLIYNSGVFNSGIFPSGESNYAYDNNGVLILNTDINDTTIYSGRFIGGNSGLFDLNYHPPMFSGSNIHFDFNLQSYIVYKVAEDGTYESSSTESGISIFRPQWNGQVFPNGRSVYVRSELINPNATDGSPLYNAYSLSTSNLTKYPDFLFREYIHYLPDPRGGQGLLDISPSEIKTQVTISRNINIATWSPYSGTLP